MQNRKAEILFLCVVVGIWYFLGRSYKKLEIQRPKTCAEWNESTTLSNRCIRSQAPVLSIDDIEQRLSYLMPTEMIRHHDVGASDWYALVLFPSIEYELVRRCVLEGEDHSYCDSVQREEYHRLVNKRLIMMLASKNEEVKHRGMILACERSKKGRILEIPTNAPVKLRNMILYTQLCSDSAEERKQRIRNSLKDDSLRSMALLSLIQSKDIDVSFDVNEMWSPLEKSFSHGAQE